MDTTMPITAAATAISDTISLRGLIFLLAPVVGAWGVCGLAERGRSLAPAGPGHKDLVSKIYLVAPGY
jgi:hypothetical protein